jgi:hypothetical protein
VESDPFADCPPFEFILAPLAIFGPATIVSQKKKKTRKKGGRPSSSFSFFLQLARIVSSSSAILPVPFF